MNNLCHKGLALLMGLLSLLYLHGPSLGGVGFWNGQDAPDICARLTGVGARFWEEAGHSECRALIRRQVRALAVVGGALGLLLAAAASAAACAGCCVLAVLVRATRAPLHRDATGAAAAPAAAPAAAAAGPAAAA